MADKNLHDIKIDDLENSKKTPLKNILTLLALLFIILVISVGITKLILNTDDDNKFDNNASATEIDTKGNASSLATTGAAIAGATGAVIAGTQNSATNATGIVKDAASTAKDGLKDRASSASDAVKESASNGKDAVKEGAKDLSAAALKERNLTGSKTKVTLRDHRPLSSVKELVTPKSPAKKDSSSTKKATTVKKTTTSKSKNDRVVAKKSTSSKKATSDKSIVGYTLTSGYYIKIGTFKNTDAAVKEIKKTGLNYKLIKVKNDKTLTRVFIGTFSSKANAQSNLSKAKKISKGAYIIKK